MAKARWGLALLVLLCCVSWAEAGSRTLTWDNPVAPPGDAATYVEVHRKAEHCAAQTLLFTFLDAVVAPAATYVDLSPVDGIDYCYAVRAGNLAGLSTFSNAAELSSESAPVAPSALVVTGESPGPIMAISLVAHAIASAQSLPTTSAIDTTGATLLVAVVARYSIGDPTNMHDSKTNTWVAAATATVSGSGRVELWYVKNPTVGSGHTFDFATSGSNYVTLSVAAFSGTDTTANRDQENSAQTASATTLATGSVTPSADNELLVAGASLESGAGPLTIDSGFTITDQASYVSGQYFGGALAYFIQGTAAAVNPTWTMNATAGLAAGIDTFKAAAAVGPTAAQEIPAVEQLAASGGMVGRSWR